jgi:hypothetical protein
MSTVDTHVNLASSYFVNDIYRRFLVPRASDRHYVLVARLSGAAVMAIAAYFAVVMQSIRDLFTFFLAFLAGVGPVYLLRWFWWRVRASTEIAAMLASSATATWLTVADVEWRLGPLSPGGALSDAGRVCLVVLVSGTAALAALALTRTPDPARLVEFYRRVRPIGAWGPVRRLAPGVAPGPVGGIALGIPGALLLTYGALFGIGFFVLGREGAGLACLGAAAVGAVLVRVGLADRAAERSAP